MHAHTSYYKDRQQSEKAGGRKRDRQTERQTDRYADRQTDVDTDQAERHGETKAYTDQTEKHV